MRIFLTGASGYIGSSLAKRLAGYGHTVFGLIRNPDYMERVRALGVTPVLGTLEDSEMLSAYASKADAVIHAADADHRQAVETIVGALSGSGKAFLHTSGSSVVADDVLGEVASSAVFGEETPFVPIEVRKDRVSINQYIRTAGIKMGVRTIVVAPSMIYGDSLGLDVESDQLPVIFLKSLEAGKGLYLGKGLNVWSNVHIADLTDMYLLALHRAPAGSYFYAENGEESYRDLAGYVSRALGFEGETASWPASEALAELGDWARYALGSNSRVRARHARNSLGWSPHGVSVADWIASLRQV